MITFPFENKMGICCGMKYHYIRYTGSFYFPNDVTLFAKCSMKLKNVLNWKSFNAHF